MKLITIIVFSFALPIISYSQQVNGLSVCIDSIIEHITISEDITLKTEFHYDNSQKITKIEHYIKEKGYWTLNDWADYSYEDTLLTSIHTFGISARPLAEIRYTYQNGQLAKRYDYAFRDGNKILSNKTIYEYKGRNLVKVLSIKEDINVQTATEYAYDSKNNISLVTLTGYGGKKHIEHREYNDRGWLISEQLSDSHKNTDETMYKNMFEYDLNSKLISLIRRESDMHTQKYEFCYDNQGNMICCYKYEVSDKSMNQKHTMTYQYSYDVDLKASSVVGYNEHVLNRYLRTYFINNTKASIMNNAVSHVFIMNNTGDIETHVQYFYSPNSIKRNEKYQ